MLLFSDYMSPTNKTRKAHAQSAALSPILKAVMKVSFKLGTRLYRSKKVWPLLKSTLIYRPILIFKFFETF